MESPVVVAPTPKADCGTEFAVYGSLMAIFTVAFLCISGYLGYYLIKKAPIDHRDK